MPQGYLALVLHAHLPYVRHPEYDSFHEESWLFEAIAETYIPLLQAFERLVSDGVPFRVTLSLSPTLVTMLRDPLLQQRYREHVDRLLELAREEVARHRGDPAFEELARFYVRRIKAGLLAYEQHYQCDLVGGFIALRDAGVLELVTSTATHGYLPLLRTVPSTVRAQLLVATTAHTKTFGRGPEGLWLPECGYYTGLDRALADAGLHYVVLESHGLLHAVPAPSGGVFAPVETPAGIVAFGRDPACARDVWSTRDGYPADPNYREFYRDVGFDRDPTDLARFLRDGHAPTYTGLKYFKITGQTENKAPYQPVVAQQRAVAHAEDFIRRRLHTAESSGPVGGRPPIMVAPYDAELFGHWWFEGPQWLESVIRSVHRTEGRLETIALGDYLARHGAAQVCTPAASSWGSEGYNGYWLNTDNDWIYPHLHGAARRMETMAQSALREPAGTPRDRMLRQAARSLLLAQASDWAFIMKTQTTVPYATTQVRDHLARFQYLDRCLREGTVDQARLRALEYLDAVFPDVDYRVFAESPRRR